MTSLLRVLRFPPVPPVPEPLRGREFVAVEAAIQQEPDEADRMLSALRDLAPELDTFHPMSPAELGAVHGDPPMPTPAHGDGMLLREITPALIEAFIAAAGDPASAALLSLELRHLGGAVSVSTAHGPGEGAVPALDGLALAHMVGIVPVPDALPAVQAAVEAVTGRLSPFASSRHVKTFAERPASAAELYGDAADRVRRITAEWDPVGVLRLGHPLS